MAIARQTAGSKLVAYHRYDDATYPFATTDYDKTANVTLSVVSSRLRFADSAGWGSIRHTGAARSKRMRYVVGRQVDASVYLGVTAHHSPVADGVNDFVGAVMTTGETPSRNWVWYYTNFAVGPGAFVPDGVFEQVSIRSSASHGQSFFVDGEWIEHYDHTYARTMRRRDSHYVSGGAGYVVAAGCRWEAEYEIDCTDRYTTVVGVPAGAIVEVQTDAGGLLKKEYAAATGEARIDMIKVALHTATRIVIKNALGTTLETFNAAAGEIIEPGETYEVSALTAIYQPAVIVRSTPGTKQRAHYGNGGVAADPWRIGDWEAPNGGTLAIASDLLRYTGTGAVYRPVRRICSVDEGSTFIQAILKVQASTANYPGVAIHLTDVTDGSFNDIIIIIGVDGNAYPAWLRETLNTGGTGPHPNDQQTAATQIKTYDTEYRLSVHAVGLAIGGYDFALPEHLTRDAVTQALGRVGFFSYGVGNLHLVRWLEFPARYVTVEVPDDATIEIQTAASAVLKTAAEAAGVAVASVHDVPLETAVKLVVKDADDAVLATREIAGELVEPGETYIYVPAPVTPPTIVAPELDSKHESTALVVWEHDDPENTRFDIEVRRTSASAWVTVAEGYAGTDLLWTRPDDWSTSKTAQFRIKAIATDGIYTSDWVLSPVFTLTFVTDVPLVAAILALNPRQYYPHDNIDVSGYGDDGTFFGTYVLDADELAPGAGPAMDFTGGGYMQVPPVNLVGKNWAVIALIKPTFSINGPGRCVFFGGHLADAGVNECVQVQMHSENSSHNWFGLTYRRGRLGSSAPQVKTADLFDPGDVAAVCCRYTLTDDISRCFVNGVSQASGDIDSVIFGQTYAAWGALLDTTGAYFDHQWAEVVQHLALFVDDVPTDEEIEALFTQVSHVPPIVTAPDNFEVFDGDEIVHAFSASGGEVEADISTDGGETWDELFALTAAVTFEHDISALPNTAGIQIRYRAWRDAGGLIDEAGYSDYVYRTVTVWQHDTPVAPAPVLGLTARGDNSIRITVATAANFDYVEVEVNTTNEFTDPLVTVEGAEAELFAWVTGLSPNTVYWVRYRRHYTEGEPDAWSTPIRLRTMRIGSLAAASFGSSNWIPTDPEDLADVPSDAIRARDLSGNDVLGVQGIGTDTFAAQQDPHFVGEIGVPSHGFSVTSDPAKRALRLNMANGPDTPPPQDAPGARLRYVRFLDTRIAPTRTATGHPTWPQYSTRAAWSAFCAFVPEPHLGPARYELMGGGGWYVEILSDGSARLVVLACDQIWWNPDSPYLVPYAADVIHLGVVNFSERNTVFVGHADASIVDNDGVKVIEENSLPVDHLGELYYAPGDDGMFQTFGMLNGGPFKGSGLMAIVGRGDPNRNYPMQKWWLRGIGGLWPPVEHVPTEFVDFGSGSWRPGTDTRLRGWLLAGAFWKDKLLTETECRSAIDLIGTAAFLPALLDLEPLILTDFDEYPAPGTPAGTVFPV